MPMESWTLFFVVFFIFILQCQEREREREDPRGFQFEISIKSTFLIVRLVSSGRVYVYILFYFDILNFFVFLLCAKIGYAADC